MHTLRSHIRPRVAAKYLNRPRYSAKDMFGGDETYSLALITKFLNENNIEYKHSSANIGGFSFVEHGCGAILNDQYKLSIQTHPIVVGASFAETALQDMKAHKIVCDGTFGYYDVMRFDTPDELFEHIRELVKLTNTP